ncbi:MAG: Fic family protein [Roseburia sp.]|jgi:Fic family protein|nr:Fic family protein [Roseburia sp.]
MNDRQDPLHITNQMLFLAASISEKLGTISLFSDLSSKPQLQKENRVENIHASLSMEGVYLPPGDTARIVSGQSPSWPSQYQKEIQNTYDAYRTFSQLDPYSLSALRQLHDLTTPAFTGASSWYRQNEIDVIHQDHFYFRAPPAQLVPGLLIELFDWMKTNQNDIHPLILSSVFHSEFFQIQPFMKGNGRTARLWHIVILSHWRPVFSSFPFESRLQQSDADYYRALAESHATGSPERFVSYLLEQLDLLLTEVTETLKNREKEPLSRYVRKLLSIMEYHVPYTAGTLMERLQLKSRETFRKNYINPAIALGLVTMTLPDRPQSRNQQYIRL